jgi:hypothetical protein
MPPGVTWTGIRPAGSDVLYVYTRNYGHAQGRAYLSVRATPRAGVRARIVDYYYVAASPAAARASGLGEPPIVAQAYDGTPDNPYPPAGPGWCETTYDDVAARSECASLLGGLSVNHFTDRLLPTGLYRMFAYESASGAKTLGALRYWGVGADASSLGLDPNIPPPPQPSVAPEVTAAKALLDWIAQNGCQPGYNAATDAFQRAYNASGLGPPVSPVDGKYGGVTQGALQVVLDSATPPLGLAPDNCYGQPMPQLRTTAPATSGPTPSTGTGGLTIPTIVIAGRDFYDTLSTAQQTGFRSALFAQISVGKCPGIDFTSLQSADGLIDPGNRSAATGCFQFANAVGSSPGILDQATYSAVMANSPQGAALTTASMGGISGGSLAVAGVALLALAGVGVAVVTGKNPFELMKP